MEKFSTEYFRKLASDLKFSLSDEEIEELKKDFQAVEAQVELFESIDTEGVEPMVFPFEEETVFLRDDEVADVLSREDALSNAPDVRMGHVHVPKVVK
ncbi:Asp-tRNA(Asn)/Glu-tRNA(Gln) amidotransferase subunit GatC [Allobaculum mucilyticum]|uniref:Asp-tRNA(Asn)/Glu-tRNA(Gln) amidotransferase subunit GatC n=1 Tax=Allobaculum mucilyticum TaxID=2834459 RepID=UPI001E48C44D|nr:Asp-tRNA(Asn)/Glu-tRNA(Gln) amidotransferase subunit GatC [Allobaculum mucilyticum]UNT95669.1 Asp-tRNA(Asn)/Glu-tRNA(Gln) amidotransferase subunit GatC [Allobaculum mucilyticum]